MTTGQASLFRAGYVFIGFSSCYLVGVKSRRANKLVRCPAGGISEACLHRPRPMEAFKK
jgi:hypothetical protein